MQQTPVTDNHQHFSGITKNSLIFLADSLLFFLLLAYLPFETSANKGLALLAFVAILWLTEAVNITITALFVPILSVLLGLVNSRDALVAFADPTIFLFFGGFALATALNVQKIDQMIANKIMYLAKGDGSMDLKDNSQYVTISYNHFWDSGKMSLCGMKSESGENWITYHHNWFDHSDSRHPRIRTMSVHVYNNYYDGNAKYGVGAAKDSEAFVEANYFRNCPYPMLSSMQGSDVLADGIFSGENGGVIKAYNNYMEGQKSVIYANSDAGTTTASATDFDAYLATARNEKVPSTYKAKQGGKVYSNFDTTVDLGVKESAIDNPADVPSIVTSEAGRLNGGDFKWTFDNSVDDASYSLNTALKTALNNYKTSLVSVGGGSTSGESHTHNYVGVVT